MFLQNLAEGSVQILPDDLLWVDEHSWSPIAVSTSYLLSGALLVETARRQSGRPITLAGAPDMAWVSRSSVLRLHGWAAQENGRFKLTLVDGRDFIVAFRHHEGALEAEPVAGVPSYRDGDFYRLTLRLMEL